MHRVGIYKTSRCQGLIGGVENWRKMCQMNLSAQAEDDSFYIFANELVRTHMATFMQINDDCNVKSPVDF